MKYPFQSAFVIVIAIILSTHSTIGEIPRPRGVPISKVSLYPPGEHFVCLDGSKTISFLQVNDDFCDCPDSSDEPGTSACPDGVFHCTNTGFKNKNIPSSRVNDGICDCCDASDEYGYPGSQCVNTCLELGREERQLQKDREELIKHGKKLKNELSEKGKVMRTEREQRLSELNNRRKDAEAIRNEKENIKNQAETLEKEALQVYSEIQEAEQKDEVHEPIDGTADAEQTFVKFDSNNDGVVDVKELQTRIAFDRNRDGVVSVDEAKYFLNDQDSVDLEGFSTSSWKKMKPFLMLEAGIFKPPRTPEDQPAENRDDHEPSDGEELDDQYEEPLDTEHDDESDGSHDEGDDGEVGEGTAEQVTQKPVYDPETQNIVDNANNARDQFSEAESNLRAIDQEIRDLHAQIEKDYGLLDEFAPLEGQCFTFEDREYTYKLCPFDRASQQPRNGGSETRLGTWDRWSGTEHKYSDMLYSNGASCWNGPQRSAVVKVECGLDHKVTAVTEPNRCEYHFVFETPAACEIVIRQSDDHDEL